MQTQSHRGILDHFFYALLCVAAIVSIAGNSTASFAQEAAQTPRPKKPLSDLTSGQKHAPRAEVNLLAPESIEADVSTRRVAVTSGFTGSEIIVFGSIVNGQQHAAPGYDVIVIVDGTPVPLVARRKSNVAGIWINTKSVEFKSLPSYYAITSTRPISDIAPQTVLHAEGIGFAQVGMVPMPSEEHNTTVKEFKTFKDAVVRIKKRDNLYQQADMGVTFVGQNLFRTSIKLPANVPVGQLTARVYLFRAGKLLARHESSVSLQREGLEHFLYTFAYDYPFYYGVFAVFLAVMAGLAASAVFPRRS